MRLHQKGRRGAGCAPELGLDDQSNREASVDHRLTRGAPDHRRAGMLVDSRGLFLGQIEDVRLDSGPIVDEHDNRTPLVSGRE